jgi:hypothetical protein
MNYLGMLVIQAPVAAFVLMLCTYGHFAEIAAKTDRLRDILASFAALILGSLAVIAVALFTYGVFGALL